MDRYEELLSEHLDGALDEAGRAELAALVEADPARLKELVDLSRADRILSAGAESTADAFTRRVMADLEKDKTRFVRAVMSDVRGGNRPTARPRTPLRPSDGGSPSWFGWAAVAAGAVFALGLLIYALNSGGGEPPNPRQAKTEKKKPAPPPEERKEAPAPKAPEAPPAPPKPESPRPAPEEKPAPKPEVPAPPPEAPKPEPPKPKPVVPEKPVEKPTVVEVATLDRVEGTVTVAKAPAQPGSPLLAGFELETADERSAAQLHLPDGTKIEVKGSSRLRDVSDATGRRIFVDGVIVSDIAKQPADQSLVFVTAHAEARIVGTRIRLEAGGESTKLDVMEGRVKFTRLKDKMSLEVGAGHTSTAGPNIPLASRLLRVSTSLAALYTFREGKGGVVHDVSHAGAPLDLQIPADPTVRWNAKGLMLVAPTLVASAAPATRIVQACKASNEVSLEVWFRPAVAAPAGKDGRILTLSGDFMNQNLMLGQDEMKGPVRSYFVRLRTSATDAVGKPSLPTPDGTASLKPTHVVYARSASGAAVLYVDGNESSRATVAGTLASWNDAYRIGLGNEFGSDRAWLGEYHLAAIYSRALTADDVKQNFKAGPEH